MPSWAQPTVVLAAEPPGSAAPRVRSWRGDGVDGGDLDLLHAALGAGDAIGEEAVIHRQHVVDQRRTDADQCSAGARRSGSRSLTHQIGHRSSLRAARPAADAEATARALPGRWSPMVPSLLLVQEPRHFHQHALGRCLRWVFCVRRRVGVEGEARRRRGGQRPPAPRCGRGVGLAGPRGARPGPDALVDPHRAEGAGADQIEAAGLAVGEEELQHLEQAIAERAGEGGAGAGHRRPCRKPGAMVSTVEICGAWLPRLAGIDARRQHVVAEEPGRRSGSGRRHSSLLIFLPTRAPLTMNAVAAAEVDAGPAALVLAPVHLGVAAAEASASWSRMSTPGLATEDGERGRASGGGSGGRPRRDSIRSSMGWADRLPSPGAKSQALAGGGCFFVWGSRIRRPPPRTRLRRCPLVWEGLALGLEAGLFASMIA